MPRITPQATTNQNLFYEVVALSHKKSGHLINQDAFNINNFTNDQTNDYINLKIVLKNHCCLSISDGVSQSNNSAKAANLAVTLFSKCYDFQGINDFLLKKHVGSCTLSSLTLHYNLAITQSVGDSLIILIRNKKIYYLSFNQNYQTRINFLTKRKVNSNLLEHYLSNLKFESLNTNLNYFTVYPGDIIYLLSDGYQKILTPQRFIKLLKKDKLISYLHNYQKEINDDITIIKVTIRKE